MTKPVHKEKAIFLPCILDLARHRLRKTFVRFSFDFCPPMSSAIPLGALGLLAC